MKTTWHPSRCRTPLIGTRVVCGTSETIDSLVPSRRFIRVDLPTFARPASATKPLRNPSGAASPEGAPAPTSGSLLSIGFTSLPPRAERAAAARP